MNKRKCEKGNVWNPTKPVKKITGRLADCFVFVIYTGPPCTKWKAH